MKKGVIPYVMRMMRFMMWQVGLLATAIAAPSNFPIRSNGVCICQCHSMQIVVYISVVLEVQVEEIVEVGIEVELDGQV